jgi:hypothetical protein
MTLFFILVVAIKQETDSFYQHLYMDLSNWNIKHQNNICLAHSGVCKIFKPQYTQVFEELIILQKGSRQLKPESSCLTIESDFRGG